MLPPYLQRRPPGGTPSPPPHPPRPGAGSWEQTRRAQQTDQAYRALDLQAAVQAWDLARRLRVPVQLVPRTAARRDGHLAAVSRERYQNALHTAQASRLAAEARAQAAISYVRPGPSFIERAQREAAVRDPLAAAWGADPLNRQIAMSVLGVGLTRAMAPAAMGLGQNVGRLTFNRALQLSEQFVLRTITDGGIQYAGGLMAHNGDLGLATNEVNATAALLAGLPGDLPVHSWRNNLLAATIPIKLNTKTYLSYEPVPLTWQGGLNYAQQVGIGVGTDYLAGRLGAAVQPSIGASRSVLVRSSNVNTLWLHRQRLLYLQAILHSTHAVKASGEGLSNVLEDQINVLPNNEL